MVVIWYIVIQIWQGKGERVVVTSFIVNDAISFTALIDTNIAFFVGADRNKKTLNELLIVQAIGQ